MRNQTLGVIGLMVTVSLVFLTVFCLENTVQGQNTGDSSFVKCKYYRPSKIYFKKIGNNTWQGKVKSMYYLNPTGIYLKQGQRIEITAKGRVCREDASFFPCSCRTAGGCHGCAACARRCRCTQRCAGPEGSAKAWGLYARIGMNGNDFRTGKNRKLDIDREGELIFIIPEGGRLEWENSDCHFYRDNCWNYQVEVKIL